MSPLALAPNSVLETTFRRLVDETAGRVSSPIVDIETVYTTLEVAPASPDSRSAGEILEHLHEEIRRHLAAGDATQQSFAPMLKLLRDQLVLRQIVDGIPFDPFLPILVVIREALQKLTSPVSDFADEGAWRSAIVAAVDCVTIAPRDPSMPPSFAFEYQRQRAIARSIVALRDAGYPCTPVNGIMKMDLAVEQRLTNDLQQMVQQLGGRPIVHVLFAVLAERFDSNQQRYHLTPNGWNRQWGPSIPFGYLLNLAVRTPTIPQLSVDDAKPLFSRFQKLATDYVCLYDVEHNDPYTMVEASGKEFIAEVVRALRYDAMVGFPQLRPTDVRQLLLGLFDWVADAIAEQAIGGTIREAATLVDFILRRSRQADSRPRAFTVSFIASRLSMIAEPTLRRLLDSLSHDRCNQLFQLADDFTRADFMNKPFIRTGDEYVVMNPSWCAPSAIEAIRLAVLREAAAADREIGLAFERTVRSALQKHGVYCRWGSYSELDDTGRRTREKPEIDCLIETDEALILFELKKRAISRTARTNDLELLHSLAVSLFESQAQLARHELNLRRNGAIDLNQDGAIHRVELRGRRIERVSLSLNDLGAIQDRGLVLALLRNFAGAILTHEAETSLSPGELNKFRKAQERCRELGQLESSIRHLTATQPDIPFANCWFMSFGELLVRLDHVTDNSSLLRELDIFRRLILGMRNPYAEYKQLRQIEVSDPAD